ncbi:MAG TPA: LuxR C-terminal-related transcriptional regulator, partial [Saprospiraceae bacterium]|nr:LuxR C-terminal-related transcriptional regulator [Saprospiraceae bacterium]
DTSNKDWFMQQYCLTNREMEILRLLSNALTNKQISEELYISDQTVGVHRKNIMRKLGVSNSAALVRMLHHNNMLV